MSRSGCKREANSRSLFSSDRLEPGLCLARNALVNARRHWRSDSRESDHAAGAKGTASPCALSRSHSSAAERTATSAFAAGFCTGLTVAGKRLAAKVIVARPAPG
jgi:hypothetical protein